MLNINSSLKELKKKIWTLSSKKSLWGHVTWFTFMFNWKCLSCAPNATLSFYLQLLSMFLNLTINPELPWLKGRKSNSLKMNYVKENNEITNWYIIADDSSSRENFFFLKKMQRLLNVKYFIRLSCSILYYIMNYLKCIFC